MLLTTVEITLFSLFVFLAIGMFVRYFSIAGAVFAICRLLKEKIKHRKIQASFTSYKRIGMEIFWSLCTAIISITFPLIQPLGQQQLFIPLKDFCKYFLFYRRFLLCRYIHSLF